MKKILLLDNQYWKILCWELSTLLKDYDFIIKDNTYNPINYLEYVIENDCLILLDNYFKQRKTWEKPLCNAFLLELLKTKKRV